MLTFLNLTPLLGPMKPTRLPMPFLESAMMAQPESPGLQFVLKPYWPPIQLWFESKPPPSAFSAWKVMPRHTVMGEVHLWPLTVHDTAPSPPECIEHEPVL